MPFLRPWALFTTAFLALGASAAANAAVLYQVTVDTTLIDTQPGFINFQFNPGFDSQPAFVTISNFMITGGMSSGAPTLTGDVAGTLPATVTIGNSTAFNDYFHPFDFGTEFTFLLTFGGPAIETPNGTSTSGSTFGIALFADDGFTPLLTSDPFGFAAIAEVGLDGSVTPMPIDLAPGAGSVVTFGAVVVPEPSTWLTMSGALAAFGLAMRRRATRA